MISAYNDSPEAVAALLDALQSCLLVAAHRGGRVATAGNQFFESADSRLELPSVHHSAPRPLLLLLFCLLLLMLASPAVTAVVTAATALLLSCLLLELLPASA
jgi:hypothetical protein